MDTRTTIIRQKRIAALMERASAYLQVAVTSQHPQSAHAVADRAIAKAKEVANAKSTTKTR